MRLILTKRHLPELRIALAAVLMILGLESVAFAQQDFLYSYNPIRGSVSAYSVTPDGLLTEVAGSPFPAGVAPEQGGFIGVNETTTLKVANYLYVAENRGGSLIGFGVDPATGVLTPVPGSPYAGELKGQSCLAATPDGRFLFQGFLQNNNYTAGGQSTISVYSIAPDGGLSRIGESPFVIPGGLVCIKVSPDGRFLAVAQWFDQSVSMLTIGADGSLTLASGSPKTVPRSFVLNDLSFNSSGTLLFVRTYEYAIVVLRVEADGSLTQISTAPIIGGNPETLWLSPNDQFAFVSDVDENAIHVLKIAADGSLAKVPGSPFDNPGGRQPHQMAMNRAGTILYVTNLNNTITVFRVSQDGALAPVSGSPFKDNGEDRAFNFISPLPQRDYDLRITSVVANGRDIVVSGLNFDNRTKIFVDGKEQRTKNDPVNWTTVLIGRKALKGVRAGEVVSIQVRSSQGRLSSGFAFTR